MTRKICPNAFISNDFMLSSSVYLSVQFSHLGAYKTVQAKLLQKSNFCRYSVIVAFPYKVFKDDSSNPSAFPNFALMPLQHSASLVNGDPR